MASRPPENDDVARNRWIVIQIVRLGGVFLVILGLLVRHEVVALPEIAAYVFIAVGLVEVFLMPTLLARMWSSNER